MKHNFTKEDYENAVKVSLSIAGVCRYLGISPRGGNYATVKKRVEEYDIDTSHFTGKGWNVGLKFKPYRVFSLEEILRKDFPYNTQRLKQRLIESGIKEKKCECCGLSEWNGKDIPLELHHLNGDRTDNRLENLQILCPNCHAQTDSYRGKNQTRYKLVEDNGKSDLELKAEYNEKCRLRLEEKRERQEASRMAVLSGEKPHELQEGKRYCKHCGVELDRKQHNYCSQECAHHATSKRPPVLELMEKMKECDNNLSAVGRLYGVSDNAVRKWLKLYKL